MNSRGINIDSVENIVSLCPNCHRKVHSGEKNIKENTLKKIFNDRKQSLRRIGIDIRFEELLELYK